MQLVESEQRIDVFGQLKDKSGWPAHRAGAIAAGGKGDIEVAYRHPP